MSTPATPNEAKPYYATTPIFYVNAAPHVGHMYTMLLTDVLKRWQEVKGRKAILCTGTDEHGMKIQQAAAKADTEPKDFCDKGAETFRDLAASINVSNEIFIRTTDKQHNEGVEYAWQMLQEKGYLYESKHEGWYSVSDETFYPESQVQLIVDPPTGKKMMQSIETGKEVEWTSERNYHFKLSAFKDRLRGEPGLDCAPSEDGGCDQAGLHEPGRSFCITPFKSPAMGYPRAHRLLSNDLRLA
jgi:methionyl-tRNA synthetase